MAEQTRPVASASRRFRGAEYLRDLFGRDPGAALSLLDGDVEWIVPGDPAFGGGVHTGRDAVVRFFALVLELFPNGLVIEELREWPGAEGCVVEMILAGSTAAGRSYRNNYAFVIEVREGRVRRVREYADTSYAESVLRAEEA